MNISGYTTEVKETERIQGMVTNSGYKEEGEAGNIEEDWPAGKLTDHRQIDIRLKQLRLNKTPVLDVAL